MVFLDNFFFVVFTLVSLLWWIPLLLFFFFPLILIKKIKAKIERISFGIERFSNRKLKEFKVFQKMITLGEKAEKKGKSFYHKLANKAYQKTVWWQRMEIIEAVPWQSRVLDIGCGNGYLAKLIAENKKAKVTCVDIEDFNQTDIPTVIFDGIHLPFKDNQFEVVILSYVLHHSEFQEELLAEAARVCRGKIIIYEDETIDGGEKIMALAHEKIYNFLWDQDGKVTYHSPEEWREIFEQNNLKILEEKRGWGIGSLTIPFKKAIFVLRNKN